MQIKLVMNMLTMRTFDSLNLSCRILGQKIYPEW